jgi:hypothetical protein
VEWLTTAAADPVDPRIVYAVLGPRGIAKSVDAGSTWTIVAPALPYASAVAINPSNPPVL